MAARRWFDQYDAERENIFSVALMATKVASKFVRPLFAAGDP